VSVVGYVPIVSIKVARGCQCGDQEGECLGELAWLLPAGLCQ
jgi:hypothetical protein